MAGAGIEVRYDKRAFAGLLTAPAKAAAPDVGAVAGFMGEELRSVGNQAFAGEVDPGSGAKWKGIRPRGRSAARYGRGLLTFTEPSAVEAALGDGSLRDLLVSALWIAKTTVYALALEGTIAGVLSAVTPGAENGGTGLVAVAGGPRNEYNVLVEILSSGGLNEAVFLVTIDGLPGKRLTVPDAPGTYPIPETGITLTFEPGAEGFAAGDTFVFASAEPSAANGEVPAAVNTILEAKPDLSG